MKKRIAYRTTIKWIAEYAALPDEIPEDLVYSPAVLMAASLFEVDEIVVARAVWAETQRQPSGVLPTKVRRALGMSTS